MAAPGAAWGRDRATLTSCHPKAGDVEGLIFVLEKLSETWTLEWSHHLKARRPT
jgi:hypothetical protein